MKTVRIVFQNPNTAEQTTNFLAQIIAHKIALNEIEKRNQPLDKCIIEENIS